MNPAENYILNQKEPFQAILLQLQILIESTIPELELKYKWRIPYYYYNGKPFCFLNVTKKYVDVGFRMENGLEEFEKELVSEKRKVMKSLRYYRIREINQEVLFSVLIILKKANESKSDKR